MCPSLWVDSATFCGDEVARLCAERTGACDIKGDGDPMDICVLTEKTFAQGQFFFSRPGQSAGSEMIDGEQADDKIIGRARGRPCIRPHQGH